MILNDLYTAGHVLHHARTPDHGQGGGSLGGMKRQFDSTEKREGFHAETGSPNGKIDRGTHGVVYEPLEGLHKEGMDDVVSFIGSWEEETVNAVEIERGVGRVKGDGKNAYSVVFKPIYVGFHDMRGADGKGMGEGQNSDAAPHPTMMAG